MKLWMIWILLGWCSPLLVGYLTCPKTEEGTGGSWTEAVVKTVFDFGQPTIYVTSESQRFDPYSLIDKQRRTAIQHEYLMVGYLKKDTGEVGFHEQLNLVVFDGISRYSSDPEEDPDTVHQNLENQMLWRYFNSTGVYPWMTIINATSEETISFYATTNNNETSNIGVSYSATLVERSYFYEPQVPFDVVFEIPGSSKVLRNDMTIIQYQSFSLWRWKLSNKTVVWDDVHPLEETGNRNNTKIGIQAEFSRIENPCTKDMFLLYIERGTNSGKRIFLASPLIQSHLNEHWLYDMSAEDHPWFPDTPTAMVLTNDHFLVMTESNLFVSKSLNDTSDEGDLAMTTNQTDRKSLEYYESNPCEGFKDTIKCFDKEISEQKLFYNPVCYLYQVPHYHDYVIFMVKNKVEDKHSFSVLYSHKPYREWRILFSNVFYYRRVHKNVGGVQVTKRYTINDIVGLFFNHHSKEFDITMAVQEITATDDSNQVKPDPNPKPEEVIVCDGDEVEVDDDETSTEASEIFIRFSLKETISKAYTYGDAVDSDGDVEQKELDGIMGDGIAEFVFPENVKVENVVVNGDTQDIFFIGNQLWIAEAGYAFVYPALTGLKREMNFICASEEDNGADEKDQKSRFGLIRECSFNHPDRTYVCMNEKRTVLLAGRIGSRYSPIVTKIDHIGELQDLQQVNGWSSAYLCSVIQKHAVFVTSYSGKILMWFMHNPEEAAEMSASINSNPDDDPLCKPETKNERVCANFKKYKEAGCTTANVGESRFRMLAIDPTKLQSRKLSSDGPLVPFPIDSNSALLFEGIVPEDPDKRMVGSTSSYYTYFSAVNVGQKIYCNNYDLMKVDSNNPEQTHNCELFIQHIKSVENYLYGFRQSLYVLILQSIPMLPIPADIVVLVNANSNKALIRVDDHLNNPGWTFGNEHIGQTLYIPGEFSILLIGFPKAGSKLTMVGYTTQYFHDEYRVVSNAFFSFLMDMSTTTFRDKYEVLEVDLIQKCDSKRLAEIDKKLKTEWEMENSIRDAITNYWTTEADDRTQNEETGIEPDNFYSKEVPEYVERQEVEKEALTVKDDERCERLPHGTSKVFVGRIDEIPEEELLHGKVDYRNRVLWYSDESECDYVITLAKNPVLKGHGGRISLDLHDKLSFEVQLRAFTRLGKLMMYRPLLVITNSNPAILKVEMREKLFGDPQVVQIKLLPTGFQKGVAVITIRSLVSSMRCRLTTSVTLIVLVHRDVGRRLHINYPIATCKPTGEWGMYPRRWYEDEPGCITREELLNDKEIFRYRHSRSRKAYHVLPPNYRPPSFEGSDIPTSKNIYNADPSKPPYNSWYRISRETFQYDLCKGKKTRQECTCGQNDRLSDDETFTECKQKVYYTKRTGSELPLHMSATYDRLMRDEDQDSWLFSPKLNWSVTIEEINGRSEWFVTSPSSPYLKMINSRKDLSEEMKHYDMKSFSVGLLGTGLYHFKVTLGRFESFDETCGYFILFVATEEFNHLQMLMIMLGTIVFCMTLVFIGFLVARKRLSNMLPIQPMSHRRKLKLL